VDAAIDLAKRGAEGAPPDMPLSDEEQAPGGARSDAVPLLHP
jgi:hypothetical protein